MPFNERDFQKWYQKRAKSLGLDLNPDSPEHFYDYRAAYLSGAEPDKTGHWPSEFKKEGHPRMIIDGVNTKTGKVETNSDQWQNELYQNYINNKMSPQGRANYEYDIKQGVIPKPIEMNTEAPKQPEIIENKADFPKAHEKETAPVVIPDDVIKRFWSGDMSAQGMKNLMSDLYSGKAVNPKPEKVSIVGELKNAFTGEGKRVVETEALSSWVTMPEMHDLSVEGAFALIGTMAAGPDEIARVIKKQYPKTEVFKDSKGNYVFESSMDGNRYAIKPGFRSQEDVLRTASTLMTYAVGAAKAGAGILLKMGSAALTQFGIEASQEATGGKFNAEEIPIAAGFEGAGHIAGKVIAAGKGYAKSLPESVKKVFEKVGVKIGDNLPTKLEEAVKTAEQAGVTPMTSDVFPPKSFSEKTGQVIAERIPIVGTGGTRVAQQESREQAVKNFLSDYGVEGLPSASDDVMKDLLKKRSDDIGKYTKLKGDVIDKLSTGTTPTTKTTAAIDGEIQRLKALGNKDVDPLIDALENAKTSFSDKNLSQFEANRKIFGEKLKSTDLATVKSEAEKVDRKIYKSVNEDMGDFIKANGDPKDYTKWKVANERLSNMMEGLKSTTLKSALKKGNQTPEEIRKLLFSKKPSDINTLYRGLTPEGKSSARVAILREAAEKAGGFEKVSTAKFLSSLNKLEKSTGVFFNGSDKKALEGLKKTLELTKRAEISGVQPVTGAQNFQLLGAFGLGTIAGGVKGAAIAGGIGTAARVYESKAVRNLLIKIAKGKGNEQQNIRALTNIVRTIHQYNKKPVSASEQRRALELIGRDA